MGFLGLTKKHEEVVAKRKELMVDRFNRAIAAATETDQFTMFASLAEDNAVIDKLTDTLASEATNPITQYEDTLRAQGLKSAQIRKLTHNLYNTYIDSNSGDELSYEEMLPEVAAYVYEHQEIYSSVNLEALSMTQVEHV